MGRRYTSVGEQTASTTAAVDTILRITSATTIRPRVYGIMIGSAGAPADQAVRIDIQRLTAAGSDTAVTPQAHDPANPNALASAGSNNTGAHTYTSEAIIDQVSMNQKETFLWETLPEYGIVLPAAAANGIGLRFGVTTSSTLWEARIKHDE